MNEPFRPALINCHAEGIEWVAQFLPGENPYLLPVANKPLIEYMIDYCALSGFSHLLILDAEYDLRMAEYLGDGEKWNLKITYVGERTARDFRDALMRHRETFCQEGVAFPLLVFNGLFMSHYDQRRLAGAENLPRHDASGEKMADGIGFWRDGRFFRIDARISPLAGILDYYRVNMDVLEHECDNFCIPGYKIENGIYSGMNVVLPPDCEIESPAILGNNVALGGHCRLDHAIVGDNVIADSRCEIVRSVVLGNTYLGADLEFNEKIIVHNHVTDPFSGTMVNLLDAQLAGELRFHGNSRLLNSLLSRCGAIVLECVMALPYLFFLIWGVRPSARMGMFFAFSHLRKRNRIEMRKVSYFKYPERPESCKYRYFRALSLDKFALLDEVLRGNLALVGDYLYDAEDPWTEVFVRGNYAKYRAGVFSISELSAGERTPAVWLIDDLYLEHNRSLRLECSIILRFLIFRLFTNYDKQKKR